MRSHGAEENAEWTTSETQREVANVQRHLTLSKGQIPPFSVESALFYFSAIILFSLFESYVDSKF
jgi:hypothetical protein